MHFTCTYFHNFRNLSPERREWSPGFNLITGPNGAGKTNFLEGLGLVSGWGPLERGTRMSALIRWRGEGREDRASLWGGVDGEEPAEVFASLSARCSLRFCDRPTGASVMRSRVPVLSFLSGHISLLRGGASHRRQLLDRVGALISPSYAKRLHDYRHALRQKAALLRRGCDPGVANRVLVPIGSWLWTAREEIVGLISSRLNDFDRLLPRGSNLSLAFERGGACGVDEVRTAAEDFRISLDAAGVRERAAKTPLVGPQRDELRIRSGVREAATAMSRGQSSRTASAISLAAAAVVERSLGRKPVLVFDEIAAELDAGGREAILGSLLATGCQIFAATTEIYDLDGITVHRIEDGRFL